MVKRNRSTFALLGIAFALGACTPPKTEVTAPAPVVKKEETPVAPVELPPPALPPDDIRMPDMLTMPTPNDFRPTNPILPKNGPDSGAVMVRPPTDPPSRVKPKPDEDGEN